jgi:REase_AHJR-like
MEATTLRERQRARAIAAEYRGRGYEVIEQPSPEQLPAFLSGYHPAMLVQKGDEAIIVEVKSRSSLIKDPRIRELARLVQAEPDWNFELVVVGIEEQLNAPEGAAPFERDDILRSIEVAERLVASGFSEAALLLAWSTLEATVRLLTEEEGLVLEGLNPLSILTQATSNGVIARDDYNFLTKVMKYRNALAHGFKTIDFDPVLVTELVGLTKRLLQSISVP